jgi:uncharacterized protein (DUF924 family)
MRIEQRTTMTTDPAAQSLLDFWFSEPARKHWFDASADFDRDLARRFGDLHRQATAGTLDTWADTPAGALALVLLLDQCSRNLYRDDATAYANDEHARRIARDAITQGFDKQLEDQGRAFLYLPFMHSESLEDQEYSVRLFSEAGLDNTRYALHHRDIIRRFGRFPHRNKILKRENTPEEIAYLNSKGSFLG